MFWGRIVPAPKCPAPKRTRPLMYSIVKAFAYVVMNIDPLWQCRECAETQPPTSAHGAHVWEWFQPGEEELKIWISGFLCFLFTFFMLYILAETRYRHFMFEEHFNQVRRSSKLKCFPITFQWFNISHVFLCFTF